jgi:hypothetical protein
VACGTHGWLFRNLFNDAFSVTRLYSVEALMGEVRNVHNVLVGKLKGKRPLGRSRSKWEDGIRVNPSGIG